MGIPVLYSLPDGEQIRVLLRTHLLDALSRDDRWDWHFVGPGLEDPRIAPSLSRPRVHVHGWSATTPPAWARQFIWLREEVWRVRTNNASARVFARRMRRWQPRRFFTHHLLARLLCRVPGVDRALERGSLAWGVTSRWAALLDAIQPAAIVLGSGGIKQAEAGLGLAARQRGIPIYGIIPSWDNLTTKGPLRARSDRLSVWCPRMRDEAVELYQFDPRRIDITGPCVFDVHFAPETPRDREAFLARTGLDPLRRTITYTSIPAWNCPFSAQYVELLLELLRSGAGGPDWQLLVRLHPQDDPAAFRHLENLDRLRIERPGRYLGSRTGHSAILDFFPTEEDVRHFTQTLRQSDVVINLGSTISLDAFALDRPVINLVFNPPGAGGRFDVADYYQLDHYRPVVDSGAAVLVHSPSELALAIADQVARPARLSVARQRLYRQYDPFGDGRSAARLAGAISAFLESAVPNVKSTRRAG